MTNVIGKEAIGDDIECNGCGYFFLSKFSMMWMLILQWVTEQQSAEVNEPLILFA